MKSRTFSLYKIAACDLYGGTESDSELKVPNIQRGLVWKSQQMELLWDSILREFPIGSMLALKNDENHYDILDGQQRSNAIITGFNTSNIFGQGAKLSSILWIDLNYSGVEEDAEFRKYGIRLTNSSHPWGYDKDGNKLSADQRRKALVAAYGENYPKLKKDWDIRKFIPYAFVGDNNFLPIPLPFIVNAAKDKKIDNQADVKRFWEDLEEYTKRFSEISENWHQLYFDKVNEFIRSNQCNESFYGPFFKLNEYEVIFNYIDSNDEIEVLFNRINKLGTKMSDAELAYAAIKHYGADLCECHNIGKTIKEESRGLMLEQNLAQILFRYCFSGNKMRGNIEAKTVRKYKAISSSNNIKEEDARIILELRNCFRPGGYMRNLLARSKDILLAAPDGCPLPSFLYAEIADSCPDLILLLLRLVQKHEKVLNSDQPSFIQALIFYLYCFSTDVKPAQYIFEAAGKEDFNRDIVINILRDSISREWCYSIPQTFSDFAALDDNEFSKTWKLSEYSDEKWYDAFSLLFPYKTRPGLFMLKYAQRHYYNCYFKDYDPSIKELWDEINRPWDHDHIIPQNWISEGDWKTTQSVWINSMGNIADIPFEQNRGKSDEPDWSYYKEVTGCIDNDKLLYFNPKLAETNRESFAKGYDSETKLFMSLTKERFLQISDEFLSLFSVLRINEGLSPMQQERKDYVLYLMNNQFPNSRPYYKGLSDKEFIISDMDDCYSWQRPWISLMENRVDASWRKAVSIYIIRESPCYQLERGNRKSPSINLASNGNLWWEKGSFKMCWVDSLLNEEGLSEKTLLFISGAEIYNNKSGIDGFITNSSAIISFEGIVKGVPIISFISDYYNYYYCTIKCKKDSDSIPDIVFSKFDKSSGFYLGNGNKQIEKKLYHKDELKRNYDKFEQIMIELMSLN